MRDQGGKDQDRILRSMEVQSFEDDVNVTPAIMKKAHEIHQKRLRGHQESRRKAVMVATVLAILIFSSFTVYASTYLIQIKNKEGKIILETKEPGKFSNSEYNEQRKKEAESKLSTRLKPGEQAVYYFKDQEMTPDVKQYPLNYFYIPIRHDNYEDLAKEIEEKDAPKIPPFAYVPDGYIFDHGRIMNAPEPAFRTPEYNSLLNELKQEAEKSKEESGLFYKIVPSTHVDSTVVEYRKGEYRLTFMAFARTKGVAIQVPSKEAIKLNVKGKEMLFSTIPGQSSSLSWLSEDEEVFYWLRDDPKDPMSRDEFVKIAEGIPTD